MGFELAPPNSFGVSHRFFKGDIAIDVLGPDGLRKGTRIVTIKPAFTVAVPGGTQALKRTELVEVVLDGAVALIPRPNLLGAILVKARAVFVDDVPSNQLKDLAFLLSLVADPFVMAEEMRGNERSWLRDCIKHLDELSVWDTIENGDDAYDVSRILTGATNLASNEHV